MQEAKYLNNLICHCAPENGFAQESIESAIVLGRIRLTYDFDCDAREIMSQYDHLCAEHRRLVNHNAALLRKSYEPIFKEIVT